MGEGLAFIVLIAIIAWIIDENEKSKSSVPHGPVTMSFNTLVVPNEEELKCDNCGNEDINAYKNLDSYTFDIICDECKSTVWKNPDREKRMEQIDSMLD